MNRDAKMKSYQYLRLVAEKIGFETDMKLVEAIIGRTNTILSNFLPDEDVDKESNLVFDLALKHLRTVKTAEERIIWARASIWFAYTKESVKRLLDILDNAEIPDFSFDSSQRWALVQYAIAHGFPDGLDRLHKEEKKRFL